MTMRSLLAAVLPLFLAALPADAGDSPKLPGGLWRLSAMDAQPMEAPFTLDLAAAFTGTKGMARQISGKAACNQYVASVEAEYPVFAIGPILATKMACPEQMRETEYFGVLTQVTTVDWNAEQPDRLALSDATGVRLEFVPAPADEDAATRDG